jgi:hypothetical protein
MNSFFNEIFKIFSVVSFWVYRKYWNYFGSVYLM